MLVTIVMGPTWLEHNKTLCQSLSFLSSLVLITCFLVLFFLAVFCQNVQHHIPLDGKRRSKRGRYGFLAMCLLAGLLLGVQILLGWSVFNDLHLVPSCTFLTNAKIVPSKNSFFYLVCSFSVLSFLTIFLAVRAVKQRRLYPLQMFWERHKYEEKINDPEMTTVASISSSNQSRATIRSNRSYWSRRSSGARSGVLSVHASPLVSRKSSQQSRLHESVLLDVLRQAHLKGLRQLPFAANGTNEDAGKDVNEITYPASALEKDAERTPSSRTSRSASTPPRDQAFVIPWQTPIFPIRKKVFQSPRFLPQFKALQQQRSLSRLLLLQSSVTGLCWLPFYVAVVLLLSQVQYPQELHVFIQWLIFVPPSISPLFPLCDACYRRVLRRAACSLLKICACGNQTETAESCDVEFKVEGTQQVRLMAVRPLEIETLEQTY
ncbi:uncharacterized protein LOC144655062 [Oculina patagonica]